MKKAIIAVPYLSGKGGTETVIKNFYDAISTYSDSKEWSWKLISFGGTKYSSWIKKWPKKMYKFSNNRIIQLGCYMTLLPFLILHTLKEEQPDVFVATNPIIWTLAYKFKKFFSRKTKIIAWYHYSFKMKNVKAKYLKTADRFWAISSGIREELLSMGISPDKIDLIYNPIPVAKSNYVRRSDLQNHFIYIGRVDYEGQKNVSELIKAFNQLKTDNWHCDLYGNIDKNTKEKLLKLANSNTFKKISFKGFYDNVWSHIDEADAIILTSKFEGLPMVLMEALVRGIALISSDCPTGTKDIVTKKNGWLYKTGEEKQLASILYELISYKKKLPSAMNVKRSVQKFNYYNYRNRIFESLKK